MLLAQGWKLPFDELVDAWAGERWKVKRSLLRQKLGGMEWRWFSNALEEVQFFFFVDIHWYVGASETPGMVLLT